MKATEYKARKAQHLLVYGAPKTGKTELLGALAEHFKLWVFSFDGGVKTWMNKESAAYKYLDNIELFVIPDSQMWPIGVKTMLEITKMQKSIICHRHGAVNCSQCGAAKLEGPEHFSEFDPTKLDVNKDLVVIDHMTQLMDSVINNKFKDKLLKDDFDIETTFKTWAHQGAVSDRFGSTWQNAPYNLAVVSHEVMAEGEDGIKRLSPVGGTRNKSADFGRYFDHIIYTEIVAGEFKAQVSAGDKSRTVLGSRSWKKLKTPEKGKRHDLFELFKDDV